MFIGYFDYLIFGILVFLNIYFWKKKLRLDIGCFVGIVAFGIILPILSMFVEIQRYSMTYKYTDAFEFLYTSLRFPMYWAIGILQAILIMIKERFASR